MMRYVRQPSLDVFFSLIDFCTVAYIFFNYCPTKEKGTLQ